MNAPYRDMDDVTVILYYSTETWMTSQKLQKKTCWNDVIHASITAQTLKQFSISQIRYLLAKLLLSNIIIIIIITIIIIIIIIIITTCMPPNYYYWVRGATRHQSDAGV